MAKLHKTTGFEKTSHDIDKRSLFQLVLVMLGFYFGIHFLGILVIT